LLSQRLATAALGIPLIVLVVWVGDALLAALFAVAVFIASIELAVAREAQRSPLTALAALCGATLPTVALAGEDYLLGGVIGSIGLISAAYTLTRDPQADLDNWLWGIATAVYFGGLAAFFVLLRDAPDGRDLVFFVFLTVWITDTGAYFVGRAIGTHKLAPAISPGKTVEGGVGSLVAGFIAVFLLNEVFGFGLGAEHLVALGLLLPPIIMAGDLAESALKRAIGVKDSSGLVPGHGGVADRLDSLLFAAPFVFYYIKWVVG
jgi:phosphatidate cytidylyltransferase